jgi:hypothetical protein
MRDKDGEIRKKRSDTLVRTLRDEYGDRVAEGYRSDGTPGRSHISAHVRMPPRAAVVIEPVSADNLRKTGISADKAGDFPRIPPQDRKTGSAETKSKARNGREFRPITASLGKLGRTPDCQADLGRFELAHSQLKNAL